MASLFFRNFHFFCIGGPLCSGSGAGSGKIEKWGWKLAVTPNPHGIGLNLYRHQDGSMPARPQGTYRAHFSVATPLPRERLVAPRAKRALTLQIVPSNLAPCPGVIPGSGRGCGRTARRVGGASRPAGGRPAAGGGGFGRRKPGAPPPGRRRSPPGAGRGRGRGGRR